MDKESVFHGIRNFKETKLKSPDYSLRGGMVLNTRYEIKAIQYTQLKLSRTGNITLTLGLKNHRHKTLSMKSLTING